MSRTSSWPLSDTHRLPAAVPARAPRQPFPRIGWVLAVSAFICGAMLSAAGFAIGWKHEAQRGSDAQTALAAATARTHVLSSSLTSARAATAKARAAQRHALASSKSAQADATALLQRAQALVTALNATSDSANAVSDGASAVGSDLAKLTSELRVLTSYLTSTPPAQLDSGYIATQTAYLTKTIGRIGGEQSNLGAAVSAYANAVQAAASRASALNGRN